jgi:hypothetical protein
MTRHPTGGVVEQNWEIHHITGDLSDVTNMSEISDSHVGWMGLTKVGLQGLAGNGSLQDRGLRRIHQNDSKCLEVGNPIEGLHQLYEIYFFI